MKLAIISESEKCFPKSLAKRAEEKFEIVYEVAKWRIKLRLKDGLTLPIFYKKKLNLRKLDCVLPIIEPDQFSYFLVKSLEGKVFLPNPSESYLITGNKFFTLQQFQSKGLVSPMACLCTTKYGRGAAKNVIRKSEYPLMIKTLDTIESKGIMLAETKEAASSYVDTLHYLKQLTLIEEFLENEGEELVGFIVGEEVVACLKVSKEKTKTHEPKDEEIKAMLKAAESVKAKIATVHCLITKKGLAPLKVVLCPDFELFKKYSPEIESKIVSFLYEGTKLFLKK